MSSFRPEDLMKKMGWTEGKGLGKNLQGIADPIRVVKKDDNSGVCWAQFWFVSTKCVNF
jgi:hypothetical protein